MQIKPKLTTTAACRVARIDRDRFNEAVSAGFFSCAPKTVPGRARLFDPDDMIALWLFRELMEDGLTKERAGYVACQVADAARAHPEAQAISFVNDYFSQWGDAFHADQVPNHADWANLEFSGSDVRKVTTFNIAKLRELIAHQTEEERSIIGPDD